VRQHKLSGKALFFTGVKQDSFSQSVLGGYKTRFTTILKEISKVCGEEAVLLYDEVDTTFLYVEPRWDCKVGEEEVDRLFSIVKILIFCTIVLDWI